MNLKRLVFFLACLCSVLALLFAAGCKEDSVGYREKEYEKIVILGPNLTEITASLGCSEYIIGIDDWSDEKLAGFGVVRVGGILDPNLELIAYLEPDAVFVAGNPEQFRNFLSQYSIQVFGFNVEDTSGIIEAVQKIAEILACNEEGERLIFSIRAEVKEIAYPPAVFRPKVIVAITSEISSPEKFMSANGKTFLGEIISIAGGDNVLKDNPVLYPEISREAVILLDPDVIIELRPTSRPEILDSLEIADKWKKCYPGVSAIVNGNVHVCFSEKILVPGPDFPESAKLIKRIIERAVRTED